MNDLKGVTAASEPLVAQKLHSVGRKLGVPVSGTFELTAGCNFNCEMCYIHSKNAAPRPSEELTAAQWLKIGEEAANAGTVFLLLTGGEPLLRSDFEEIYSGLKQMGMMITINTNGSLLTGKTAALFEKSPPVRLNVSLYADNREGYLRQCGVDAFDLVLRNIRRMCSSGVEVKINTSFTKYNADRCKQIAALVHELELHCQASFYMYPPVRRSDNAAADARLSPAEAAEKRVWWNLQRNGTEEMLRTKELLQKLAIRECENDGTPTEGVRCRAGHTSYWIDASGHMLMCGMIAKECGNVLTEGFDRCWQNTRALMRSVTMPAKCTACNLRPICSVCPAACFAETGGFTEAPSYLCEMSRAAARAISSIR